MSSVARPWQGTTLAVFFYLATAMNVIGAIMAVAGFSLLGGMTGMMTSSVDGAAQMGGVAAGVLGGLGVMAAVLMLIGALINYVIARGFWKGSHWPITLVSIIGVIWVLFALMSMNIAMIIIAIIPPALAIPIWKNPFYNKS